MVVSKYKWTRRGSVSILVAVSGVLLLSIVAITLDGGVLQEDKRHAQATADAAALAGATVLFEYYPKYQGVDTNGKARQAVLDCAAVNGFTNPSADLWSSDGGSRVINVSPTTTSVTVNIPPATGIYAGKAGYVEVNVIMYQNRAFSRVFGAQSLPVRARAVARGAWVVPNIGVIVLDYTGKATLSSQGNGAFTETGAPVIVNSNNTTAVVDTGNGILRAPEFDITGGFASSGGGQLITSPVPNNIYTGVHPTPDPLAYLPTPSMPPAGTMTKVSLGMGKYEYTLSPGAYSNLPVFNVGDVVTFKQASAGNHGIFYLSNGGFTSTGANIRMDTNSTGGMMLYNAGTGTSDKINITGNSAGSVNLTPLTSGIYTGMTVFQNRAAAQEVHIEGNGSFDIRGTFYTANAELQVTGNGTFSNVGSQYVTRELALAGNGNVGITWDGTNVARTRIITLVE